MTTPLTDHRRRKVAPEIDISAGSSSEPADRPALVGVVPVRGMSRGRNPAERPPDTSRESPVGLDVLRRHADPTAGAQVYSGPGVGIDRLRRTEVRRATGPGVGVIRRAPTPTTTRNVFSDPDAPGFLFIATGTANEYVIEGSTIKVYWNPEEGRWLSAEGLVVVFQDATEKEPKGKGSIADAVVFEDPHHPEKAEKSEKPARKATKDKRGKKPPKDLDQAVTKARGPVPPRMIGSKLNPAWTHYSLEMEDFTRLGLEGMMAKMTELADSFNITTPIEKLWAGTKKGNIGRFYRYHKFSLLPSGQSELVFGGGINKTEITPEWLRDNLKVLLNARFNLLKSLKSEDGPVQADAMEIFQANAMTTPFIATTSNLPYAEKLFTEYPPEGHQRAVILVIDGPVSHAFDFEKEFRALGESQGGKAEWNFRSSKDRAKDAEQLEFGLPDLFIPMKGVSPYGFSIVKVIECGLPPRVGLGALLASDPTAVVVRESEVTLASTGSAHQGDRSSDKKD